VVMQPTLDQAIEALFGKRPAQPIVQEIPPTPIPQDSLQASRPSAQNKDFSRLQTLWSELQTALQNGNWQTFGEKMDAIEELLDEQ